jgi:hypothetical protein
MLELISQNGDDCGAGISFAHVYMEMKVCLRMNGA